MLGRGLGRLVVAAAVLAPLAWSVVPADAATVVYYSAPDNVYGWCAGYGYDRGHSCAKRYCIDAGGTACEMALECAGGWGAIAFAQHPAIGFGASCDMGDAVSARKAALVTCMAAANALCWTESTFSRNATTTSEASNRDFDMTWFSQGMLNIRHFDAGTSDGKAGPKTRAAIGEFQTRIGRPATGVIDDELFLRFVDAVGGAQNYIRIIKRDLIEPNQEDLADHVYGYAGSPLAERSFSEELMERPAGERLTALATVLASDGMECTLPAVDAQVLGDASSGFWSISCAEASYTLIMSEGTRMISRVSATKTEPQAQPEPERQPQADPSPQPQGGHRRH